MNEPLILSENAKRYLAITARNFVEDANEDESHEIRDSLWEGIGKTERASLNEIVDAVFGEWL